MASSAMKYDWMPQQAAEDGVPVLDVAIIGAGQAGLAAASALAQQGIHAVVFDRAPRDFEGPWATTARMETLRSPKELTGPALGLPALTFRAWFEAQFGIAAWDALDKIPRLQWAEYLRWYRQVLGLDVRNRQRVTDVRPRADGVVQLTLADDEAGGAPYDVLARHAARGIRVIDTPRCGAWTWRNDARPELATCERERRRRHWHDQPPGP